MDEPRAAVLAQDLTLLLKGIVSLLTASVSASASVVSQSQQPSSSRMFCCRVSFMRQPILIEIKMILASLSGLVNMPLKNGRI